VVETGHLFASQNASRVRHLHMTTTSAAVSTRPGRVTLGRWQVLRASARVWAAPPGAATASGGCAAIRRQRLTDETGSPAEPSGFELLVPPSFSQLATQAERRSQSARRESTSLLEGGLGVRIRLAPARSLRTDSPRAHPCLSNPTSVSKGRHPLFVIVSSSSCPTAGSRHSICRSSIFEIGNSRSRAGCLKSSRHR
jgi:hypothetical protein